MEKLDYAEPKLSEKFPPIGDIAKTCELPDGNRVRLKRSRKGEYCYQILIKKKNVWEPLERHCFDNPKEVDDNWFMSHGINPAQ
jgi:hypothetical protein